MVSLPGYDTNLFVNGISQRRLPRADGQPVAADVQPQRARRRPAGLDGEAADRPGRRRQRPAHGPRTRCSRPARSTSPASAAATATRTAAPAGPTCASRSPQSVNYYYYKLAYDMGIERFDQYMRRYGFGQPTGIDLAGENDGRGAVAAVEGHAHQGAVVPGRDRDRRHRPGLLDRDRAAAGARHRRDRRRRRAASAAPGRRASRRLRRAVDAAAAAGAGPHHRQRRATCARCRKAWSRPIHGRRHRRARWRIGAPYMMAGKTGTAQKIGRRRAAAASIRGRCRTTCATRRCSSATRRPTTRRSRSRWSVEHGGYGGSTAAPIARKIFDAWLLGKMPEPVPTDPQQCVRRPARCRRRRLPRPRMRPTPVRRPATAPAARPPAAREGARTARKPHATSGADAMNIILRWLFDLLARFMRTHRPAAARRAAGADGDRPGGAVQRRRPVAAAW